ncbi:MAG: diguanylate cyclase/phosphodiesterase (GGDEF & EAL domains) with PAS/PAC sensor(s) [uncultured Lysobacter sp.]|uniref:Diguanylate cyclase/phosphodiesterase (GGDEF & EAL domains) with PAS/PAC sensor(S) n=1 Tax=uncultured Lysobacter sp. TaxID=271060 RepID=A0A6J4KVI9_9GAMM|nr:MAG: diguanylate cyclase/phosphodiesterase (GGDEF & EAL domains) with PAS/PAC sensor(s) [uncultured Lysobacter sp.]
MHEELPEIGGRIPGAADALKRERDRLRHIVEALTQIASLNLPTMQFLDRVVHRVMELTSAIGAVVELVDGDELEYAAVTGSIERFKGLRLQRSRSLSGRCVDHRALQYSLDTETDDRVNLEACRAIGARSMMLVPLSHMGESIGVLKVVSDRPGAFDETDEYALRLCAGLVGSSIGRQVMLDENRRLLDDRSAAWTQATTVFNASPIATVVHDLDGTVRMWNDAAAALFGWTSDEAVGHPPPYLADSDMPRFTEISQRIMREGTAATEIVRRSRRDGTVLELRVSGAPLRDTGGEVVGIVRTMEDVTDQRQHGSALKAAAERLRHIIEHSPHAFISMDASGRVLEWNNSAEAMFGWTRREAIFRPLHELVIPPDAHDAHLRGVKHHLDTRESRIIGRPVEVVARHKDGTEFPIDLTINMAEVDGQPVYDAFLENASERRTEMDSLRQQASLDMLTQLPNRERFHAAVKAALERRGGERNRVAVVLVNLDGFRAINDLLGHAAGDALLQAAAERLVGVVREQDIVARLGGDEFGVLLDGLRDARRAAPVVAGKLLAAFDEQVVLRTATLPLQASVGVAVHEYERDDVEAMLHVAVEAMRRAKRAGGHRVEVLVREHQPD